MIENDTDLRFSLLELDIDDEAPEAPVEEPSIALPVPAEVTTPTPVTPDIPEAATGQMDGPGEVSAQPAPRFTSTGAVMSPRMAKLWAYIRDERKIALYDFSTDSSISRVLPQLQAALDSTEDPEIRGDLTTLMRRVPSARITPSGTASPAKVGQTPPGVSIRRTEDLVAGAAAEGHGALIGWCGAGSLTRSKLAEILEVAGCPASWLKATKSARAYAGQAVMSLNASGLVARAVPGGPSPRWLVGTVGASGAEGAGEAYGLVKLAVTLTDDGLVYEGDTVLATRVQGHFDAAIGSESVTAGEITRWLRGILIDQLGAVAFGGAYYVPRSSVDLAGRLCEELSRVWGSQWIVPALPVATSEQLSEGIARGLEAEVAGIAEESAKARAARAEKSGADIGAKAATTYLLRLTAIAERVASYAPLIGDARVARIRKAANEVILSLQDLSHDTAVRGALIWEEIAMG